MTLESLRLARNILLRCVLVAVAFTLFLTIATFGFWDTWIGFASAWLRTDEAHISSAVLNLFMEIRFFIVFILLTPALSLHWTLKREEKRVARSVMPGNAPFVESNRTGLYATGK